MKKKALRRTVLKKTAVILYMMSILLTASTVWADVTIERWTKSNFVIGFESDSITKIQGFKNYDSSNVKFDNKLIGFFGNDAPIVHVTRVDKGVTWTLNEKKKTYTETPLSVFDLDSMMKKEQGNNKDEKVRNENPEKSKYKLIKSDFKVRKTGAKETINGFSCEEYDAVWTAVIENTETKGRLTETLETILWTTPETGTIIQVQKEESAYYDALFKKLGMDGKLKTFSRMLNMDKVNSPVRLTESDMKKYASEFSRVKGYPIRTIVKSQTIEDEKEKAARLKREQQENQNQANEDDQAEERSVSSVTSVGGLFSKLTDAASKKAAKSVADKQKEDSKQKEADRDKPVVWFTSEVRKISLDPIKASTFEIPAKYKKVQD